MIVITVLLTFDSYRLSTKRNHIAGCDNHKFSLVHRPLPREKGVVHTYCVSVSYPESGYILKLFSILSISHRPSPSYENIEKEFGLKGRTS